LGEGLARIAIDVAENYDTKYIGFSGGVALNTIVTKAILKEVEKADKIPLLHNFVPPGDAGISIGQIATGIARLDDY
jgi:hydrogenase maturation protein HypF